MESTDDESFVMHDDIILLRTFHRGDELAKRCRALLPKCSVQACIEATAGKRYGVKQFTNLPVVTAEHIDQMTLVHKFQELRQEFLPGGRRGISNAFLLATLMADGCQFGFAFPCACDSSEFYLINNPAFELWFAHMKLIEAHHAREWSNWQRTMSLFGFNKIGLGLVPCRYSGGGGGGGVGGDIDRTFDAMVWKPSTRVFFSYYNFNPSVLRIQASKNCHLCSKFGLREPLEDADALPADFYEARWSVAYQWFAKELNALKKLVESRSGDDETERFDALQRVMAEIVKATHNSIIQLPILQRQLDQKNAELILEKDRVAELLRLTEFFAADPRSMHLANNAPCELAQLINKYSINKISAKDNLQMIINMLTGQYKMLETAAERLYDLPNHFDRLDPKRSARANAKRRKPNTPSAASAASSVGAHSDDDADDDDDDVELREFGETLLGRLSARTS